MAQAVDVAADKFGDREGLVVLQQDIKRNFSELKQEIEALAAGLVELGLQPGERLGIWGPNTHEWYVFNLNICGIKTDATIEYISLFATNRFILIQKKLYFDLRKSNPQLKGT